MTTPSRTRLAATVAVGIGTFAIAGAVAAAPAHADIYSGFGSKASCESTRSAKISENDRKVAAQKREQQRLNAQGKLAPYPGPSLSVSPCTPTGGGGWKFTTTYVS